MMHGYGMMGDWSMMGAQMWISMILLWGFAIFGLICLIRWIVLHFHGDSDKKSGHSN